MKQRHRISGNPRELFVCVLFGGALALSGAVLTRAHAQTLAATISVAVDEATQGDLDLVVGFLSHAPLGAPMSKAQRRILMPAVEEIAVLGNARKSDAGLLTGDDGLVAALYDGSTFDVNTCQAKTENQHPCVVVRFGCPNMGSVCRPVSINILLANGCRTIDLTQTPPVMTGDCPPAGG